MHDIGRECSMHMGGRIAYKILVQGLRLVKMPWETEIQVRDSIKMDIGKKVFDMVNWIVLAQDKWK
jgi:hypothetical protein